MKNLFLVRHAKSSWAHIGITDFERPLEQRGLKDAPFMAEILKEKMDKWGLKPHLFVSSTAVRARTTAAFFSQVLGLTEGDMRLEQEIYEATERELWHTVRELPDDADNVVLFGHNPGFTFFANNFEGNFIDNIPTCGIVRIEANIKAWDSLSSKNAKVVDFIYPKMFRKDN